MNIKTQSGMSMWGVMMLIIIVMANAFVALKVGPIYMENQTVKRILETTREPLEKERLPKKKIWQMIYRKLIVNGIRDLGSDKADIKQNANKTTIDINYEVRKNIFYNIDVVVSFHNAIEVRRGSRHGI